MNAIIAIENDYLRQSARQFLTDLGFKIVEAADMAELERHIQSETPKFVLCDLYLKHEFLGDHPKRYASQDITWMGLMQVTDGAASEYYVSQHCGFAALLDANPSFVDLYIALQQVVAGRTNPLRLGLPQSSTQRWLRASMSTPISSAHSFSPPYPDTNVASTVSGMRPPPIGIDNLKPELKSWFQARDVGNLAHTAFAAILWKAHSQKRTGVLSFCRGELKFSLIFKNGLPIAGTTNEAQFDIFCAAKRHALIDTELFKRIQELQKRGTSSRYDCIAMLPNPQQIIKAWLKIAILDAFAWRDGAYDWQSSSYHADPPIQADFTPDELKKLIYEGVFERMPLHIILDACKDYASYFLKIKASQTDAERFFFTPYAKAIVQRLEKGDTLMEMLIYFPSQYPVHQTVYLLFIFGYLDLE